MLITSPITDLFIRIKNAYLARRKKSKPVIYSKFKEEILKILKKYRFIKDYEIIQEGEKKFIVIYLKEVISYKDIPNVKLFSKPGRRIYISYRDIKPVAGGKGIGIISTSKGVMPTHEAKKNKLGGELIAEIY